MSSYRVFHREELLSLYRQCIEDNENKLIGVTSPLPPTSFRLTGVITEEQEDEWWSQLSREDACRKLIESVLKRNSLKVYISFSQCIKYISDNEAKRIFTFIPDLFRAGLHDPLQKSGKYGGSDIASGDLSWWQCSQ